MKTADIIVLGAGIAGVSAACHLRLRGKQVVLVDRRDPGEETSFGNAGVIERDGFLPISFPSDPITLARYALNRGTAVHLHYRFLPFVAGWLLKLRAASRPAAISRFTPAVDSLERHAANEHLFLAKPAGAENYFRDNGWLHLYRSEETFAETFAERLCAEEYGAGYDVLETAEVAALEPYVRPVFHKAIHWRDSWSVSNPGAVTKAYARYFVDQGGTVVRGDALSLRQDRDGWRVSAGGGMIHAPDAVVALGPWSMDLLKPLGYRFPFVVKRGYHQNYRLTEGTRLTRPVLDMDFGYVIAPMEEGVRLTTGIEFADRDAPPTPVQLSRLEPVARSLLPLAETIDAEPWMGARPCLPDSLPIVGPARSHDGLWFTFGHGHIGLTTGPVTGRLLAELICGEAPLVDIAPFSPERF